MELTPQRGAIAIQLDRPRILFFDMKATWLLIQKYGPGFVPELYSLNAKQEVVLKSMDALQFFLWAALQADARAHGEEFTLEQAEAQLKPFTYTRIFNAVLLALTAGTMTPAQPGKTEAAGEAAKPVAAAKAGRVKGPGPTRVSTSSKRSASRSRR